MKLARVPFDSLVVSPELARSTRSKQFEERLHASVEQVGLAEPLKVAPLDGGRYLVVDGVMRYRAIEAIRTAKEMFDEVCVYLVDYDKRFELRYQTDIYQDLLPSQLAALVEHLHKSEKVSKGDIARYIGVSPPTVRNYTGLWRLLERGSLFARLVQLMDAGIIPSSNPYAWLRLTSDGLRHVIETTFSGGEKAETWIAERLASARQGQVVPISIKDVEEATGHLPAEYYREAQQTRAMKRNLGLRRSSKVQPQLIHDRSEALTHLDRVITRSPNAVLQVAAASLKRYIEA